MEFNMSDKNKKVELDEDDWSLDLDLEDNFDDFSDNPPPEPTGRDAAKAITKSAATGASKVFLSEGRRQELILKALPKEYSAAAESFDKFSSEARDVSRAAREHLIKSSKEIKRQARSVYPAVAKYLPDGINNRINELLKSREEYGSYNQVDTKEAKIQSSTNDIFNNQPAGQPFTNRDANDIRESVVTKELKDAADDVRQGNMASQIQSIGDSLARSEGYQNTVTTGYRKKMLEINYRQLFALQDLLDVTNRSMEKLIPNVERTVHNTSLPDYAKEQVGEVYSAILTRDLINEHAPRLFNQNFAKVLGNNSRKALNSFFGSINDGIGMAGSVASSMGDDGFGDPKSPRQQKLDAAKTGAELAGQAAARKYVAPKVDKVLGKIRGKLTKNKSVNDLGHKIKYLSENAPSILNSYSKSDGQYEGAMSNVLNPVVSMLGGIIGTTNGEQVSSSNVADVLEKPRPWDNKAHETLTEIIPGLLAKIDQSVRSGFKGSDQPLEQYDFKTSNFVDTNEISNRIRTMVDDKDSKKFLRDEIDKIINKVAAESESNVDESDRKSLQQLIDKKIRRNNHLDVRDIATGSWDASEGEQLSYEAQELFQRIIDNEKTDEYNDSLNAHINKLRSEVGYANDSVGEAVKRYGHQAVTRSGVFVKQGDSLVANPKLLTSYDTIDGKLAVPPTSKVADNKPKSAFSVGGSKGGDIDSGIIGALGTIGGVTGKGISFTEAVRLGVSDALYNRDNKDNIYNAIAQITESPVSESRKEEALRPLIEEIKEQLIQNNAKPELSEIMDILKSINLATVADVNNKGGNYYNFGDWKDKASDSIKETYHRAKKSTDRGLGRVKGYLRGGAKYAKKAIKDSYDWAMSTEAYSKRSGVLNAVRDKFRGVRDIYDGQGNLLFAASKLKAGEYFNEDGKAIKYIKDIKGTVFDKAGNVVISKEELADKLDTLKYWSDGKWELAKEWFDDAISKTTGVFSSIKNFVSSKTLNALKRGYNHFKVSSDIFVKGENVPRLLRNLMLQGKYVSGVSGHPIRDIFDIDGEVKNTDGNVIITSEEMIKEGFQFVDKDGNPFKSFSDRIKQGIKDRWEKSNRLASATWGKIKGVGNWVKDKAKKAGGAVKRAAGALKGSVDKRLAKYVLGSDGIVGERKVSSTSPVISRLDIIIELLKGNNTKSVSFKSSRSKRGPKSTVSTKTVSSSTESVLSTAVEQGVSKAMKGTDKKPGVLANLWKKPKKVFGDTDGDGVRENSYLDIVKDRAAKKKEELAAKLAARSGKPPKLDSKSTGLISGLLSAFAPLFGLISKPLSLISSGLSSVLGFGKFIGGGVGRAVGGIARSAGGMALNAGKWVAGKVFSGGVKSAVTTGARMALPSIASAATSAFTAIGGVAALPWLIGAAAVGGVGYLLYKKLTAVKVSLADQVRYAYYGTEDYSDGKSDDVAKLKFLEKEMLKYTKYDKQGLSSLAGLTAKATTAILKGVGISEENPAQIKMFNSWLFGRFIPVFLLWTSKKKQILPDASFEDLSNDSKVSSTRLLELGKNVHLPVSNQIFDITTGPFSQGAGRTVWNGVKSVFGAEETFGGDTISSEDVETLYQQTMYSWKKQAAEEKIKEKKPNDRKKVVTPTPASTPKVGESKRKSIVTPTADKKVTPKVTGVSTPVKKAPGIKPINSVAADITHKTLSPSTNPKSTKRDINNLNAVDAVRVKCYGIYDLDAERVKPMFDLEAVAIKHIVFKDKEPIFKGSVMDIFNKVEESFDLVGSDVLVKNRWYVWFDQRFLPVFMTYLRELKRNEPGADPLNITVNTSSKYLYKVAMAMATATTLVDGTKASIWTVSSSPFMSMKDMGTDPNVVNGNLTYLKDMHKSVKVKEQTTTVKSTPTSSVKSAKATPVRGNTTQVSVKDTPSKAITKHKAKLAVAKQPVKVEQEESISPNSIYSQLSVKSNDIQDMCGLLSKVSSITKVDEQLLYKTAYLESGMKPDSKSKKGDGLMQINPSVWKGLISKYGNKFGIPKDTSPLDPVANALLGAMLTRDESLQLASVTGNKTPTATEVYLAKILKADAGKYFKQMKESPSARAAIDFNSAALQHQDIFYDDDGAFTYKQVYDKIEQKANQGYRTLARFTSVKGRDIGISNTRANVKVHRPIAIVSKGDTRISLDNGNAKKLKHMRVQKAANEASLAATETSSAPVTVADTAAVDKYTSKAKEVAMPKESAKVADLRAFKLKRLQEVKEQRNNSYRNEQQATTRHAEEAKSLSRAHGELAFKQLEVQRDMAANLKQIVALLESTQQELKIQSTKPNTSTAPRKVQAPARNLAVSVGKY